MSEASHGLRKRWAAAAAAFAAAVALAAHARALGNGFLSFDDDVYVTANPVVREGLSLHGLLWSWNVGYGANWHPLTWISHMADVSAFGLAPRGHHLTSWLLHAGAAALVALVLNAILTRGVPGATTRGVASASGLAAAYWAAHPWRVESVAWIAERKDVLSGVLALLAVLAYLAYGRRASWRGYAIVTLLLALGLAAKPMLVSLPVIFLLLDAWPLARSEPWHRLVLEKVPWAALAAASSAVTLAAQRVGGTVASAEAAPLGVRLGNALISAATYAYGFLWPGTPALIHRFPPRGWPAYAIVAAGIGLAVVTAAAFILYRRAPWVATGWGWFLVALVPVIGFIQVGVQARADRYTYLPHLGLAVLAAAGGLALCRARPRVATAAIGVVIVAIAFEGRAAWAYTASWRDTETLLRRTLAVDPEDPYVHFFLASDYESRSLVEEAEREAREAVRLHSGLWQAWTLLGRTLTAEHRLDEAAGAYERAVAIAPGAFEGWLGLGIVRAGMNDDERALAALAAAGRVAPDDPRPFLWRAAIALRRHDLDGAREQERALRARNAEMADAVAADIAAAARR